MLTRKWYAPSNGGYNAEGDAVPGKPPTNPASVRHFGHAGFPYDADCSGCRAEGYGEKNTRIVLVCGRGWGKQTTLEQWEELYRSLGYEHEEEEHDSTKSF